MAGLASSVETNRSGHRTGYQPINNASSALGSTRVRDASDELDPSAQTWSTPSSQQTDSATQRALAKPGPATERRAERADESPAPSWGGYDASKHPDRLEVRLGALVAASYVVRGTIALASVVLPITMLTGALGAAAASPVFCVAVCLAGLYTAYAGDSEMNHLGSQHLKAWCHSKPNQGILALAAAHVLTLGSLAIFTGGLAVAVGFAIGTMTAPFIPVVFALIIAVGSIVVSYLPSELASFILDNTRTS